MQAYCMKCRKKREMKDTRSVRMKNARPATQGVCPVCGTRMFRIGKSASIPRGQDFRIPKMEKEKRQ
jgi:Zn finger protein HypA/HybF involved in hydrogenase expression